MAKLPKFEDSSGNVFADLGLIDAEDLLAKGIAEVRDKLN